LALISLLDHLEQWCRDIPPIENHKSRFGNPAYQQWFDKLAEVGIHNFNTCTSKEKKIALFNIQFLLYTTRMPEYYMRISS